MKTASFENSVNVLIMSYLTDTLVHGNCCACAVGNLIANACGLKVIKDSRTVRGHSLHWNVEDEAYYPGIFDNEGKGGWGAVFCTDWDDNHNKRCQRKDLANYIGEAKRQIDESGYSVDELARVEKAFEMASKGNDTDDWMFNGLLAVVDVLAEIHGVDLTAKENAIGQFQKVKCENLTA